MYAKGEGVRRDELKAYEYFRRVANLHADDAPGSPQAPYVASAFVELGRFFLSGIPNTAVVKDPGRAREMFEYAASWFGDANAQYELACLYLEGVGTERDPLTAARWLGLASQKQYYRAQALLGRMLFKGEGVPRQAARGLMWLTLAREAAATAEDGWIVDTYDSAFKVATEDERSMALTYLQQWLKTYR
jgi:TPR repeat protein